MDVVDTVKQKRNRTLEYVYSLNYNPDEAIVIGNRINIVINLVEIHILVSIDASIFIRSLKL